MADSRSHAFRFGILLRGHVGIWSALAVVLVLVVGVAVGDRVDPQPGAIDPVAGRALAPVAAGRGVALDPLADVGAGGVEGPASPVDAASQMAGVAATDGSESTIPGPGAELPGVPEGEPPTTTLELILSGRSDVVPSPAVVAPEQVGYVSYLWNSQVAPLETPEGGFVEGAPEAAVVSSVSATSEVVDIVDLGGALAGGVEPVGSSPVSVELVGGAQGASLSTGVDPGVSVSVLDSASAEAAGVGEIGFTVTVRGVDASLLSAAQLDDVADLAGSARVRFRVDYSDFADEYGADWVGRLRVARFGSCLLTREAGCDGPQFVGDFVNDAGNGVISFDVPLGELMPAGPLAAGSSSVESATGEEALTAAATGDELGFAVMAGASSPAGNYATTSLNPTGKWSVGTQSGSFTWSYPVSMPAPPAGAAPGLAVTYSAAAIDGLTSDQNTQGGVMGPGWSVGEGFIERQYRSCSADGGAGADYCWAWGNATFSLAG